LIQEAYNKLANETHRVGHDNLNCIMEIHQQIRNKMDNFKQVTETTYDEASLDASLQAKLNPSVLTTSVHPSSSSTSLSSLPSTNLHNHDSTTDEIEPTIPVRILPTQSNTNALRNPEPTVELTNSGPLRSTNSESFRPTQTAVEVTNTEAARPIQPTIELPRTEPPRLTQPTVELTNTHDAPTESTTSDEFEAGHTRHIQRVNPILISTVNDKFAGTTCCHGNQLIYNDYDKTTQTSRLNFIRDVTNPSTKQSISWDDADSPLGAFDDEWVQDIIYSLKVPGYLILNRARIRLLKENTTDLEEFHEFPDRTMKRLSCNDKYIYLTATRSSTNYNGDEIILMNYAKEEQLCKTFREIIPTRINRGAGPLVGEISDIAADANDQVTIGYRLERRHEVGVCVFNVINDGREWSCVKQLLLNECWHSDLSYTPRIDWCAKLNVYLLIEFMTGHLIMVDKDGQVEGECRFMHVENRRESPINLAISTNDWLCVRYETSISIHKITS
jgi:hypothetical protein